jgi:hypothetical protein
MSDFLIQGGETDFFVILEEVEVDFLLFCFRFFESKRCALVWGRPGPGL